jgi:hypothetical protein
MATVNIAVDEDWTLVASAALDLFLLTTSDGIEVAVTAGDSTEPDIGHGHSVGTQLGVTRELIGPGAVWARKTGAADAVVVVS